MSYALGTGTSFPDYLVGSAMLVLSAERERSAIVTLEKCDLPCFRYGVKKLGRYRYALSRTVLTFLKGRKVFPAIPDKASDY